MQLQLQATIEALEELKHNDQSLQIDHDALKTLLQEEKVEKKRLKLQLRVAEDDLEELKRNKGLKQPSSPIFASTSEVNNVDVSSVSSSHAIISVENVEIPITGTGMRLLTKMGYRGGVLGIHGQGITQPLEVVQRPRYACLGYTKGECSNMSGASTTLMKPSRKKDDGETSPSSCDNAYCKERAEASSHCHHDLDRKSVV